MWTYGPGVRSCPMGQGSFTMDCFKSGNVFYYQTNPNLTLLLEITDALSSRLKRREIFQRVVSVQFRASISDGMRVHKCIQYGQLACFGRHYEC